MIDQPAPMDAELARRFRLVDTHSGRVLPLDQSLPLAQDAALNGAAHVDDSNSNRGGYDTMNGNSGAFRRPTNGSFDQEEEEIDFSTSRSAEEMPPRGHRASPARAWSYATGTDGLGEAELTPEAVARFVTVAYRGFSPDEQAAFLDAISPLLDEIDLPSLTSGSNNNGDWRDNNNTSDQRRATPLVQRAGDRRQQAADRALALDRGDFASRFPQAMRIRVMG